MVNPVDNVIRFPEGTRDSVLDSSGILAEARDLMAGKLGEALRSILPRIEQELLARGDVTKDRAQRALFYGAREAIHAQAPALESALATQWLLLFDRVRRASDKNTTVSTRPEELQLVDFGTMDQELVLKAIAGSLRSSCDEDLFAAGRRLAFLSGEIDGSLPVEHLIADALQAAFDAAGLGDKVKLELLQAMERHAVEVFAPPVHQLNEFLVARGVLPQLSRNYSPPSANKKHPGHAAGADRPAEAADIFALLQKLVDAQPASQGTAGVGSSTAGVSPGVPGGVFAQASSAHGSLSPAHMAVAMEQVMATLDTLQRAAPVQAAATLMDNVLREFRSSDTGQGLDHLRAVTVDIVATLFDFIFDDVSVADPIKALVARLQIPVLKVALVDKSFFSSKAHPARRLLDGISRAAVRCGPQAGHDNPLYARLTEIVERVQNEFNQDTALFDTLCAELDAFLDHHEAASDACAIDSIALVAEQERYELAALAADQALAGCLAKPLPSALTNLLRNEWRNLLIRHCMNNDAGAWEAALSTLGDLVASVEIPSDGPSRKRLAASLPALVRRICNGLDALAIADDRRLSLIDALFSVHAAVLRGTPPQVAKAEPLAPEVNRAPAADHSSAADHSPARLAREEIVHGETRLERISLCEGAAPPALAAGRNAKALVAELQRGDWVEFADSESGPLRYRLSWISPQRGILLFTTSQSPRAISITPDALALQLESGEATLVPREPMFDRAVNRALEKLKAA